MLLCVQARHGSAEVAAERLLTTGVFVALVLAPSQPTSEEILNGHLECGIDLAAFADEDADRRGQVFYLLNELPPALRLEEMAPLPQSFPAFNRPKQDTGQLRKQLVRQ